MKKLKYAEYQSRINQLVGRVREVLDALPRKQYGHIRQASLAELENLEEQEPLTIAIVGQYSAGKSTITKALTGRDDIEIGQGVTTEEPHVYDWNGVRIVDTPGIKADRPEHDEMSLHYIDRAHLLIFVSTINGFDDLIGETFRELAIERERAGKMMLTLNKRQMEAGDNEQGWIESVKPVLEPLSIDDVRLTIIDAEEYLESQDDEEFGDELRRLSHFDDFIAQLNDFIQDRRLNGRLLACLNVIETTTDNALKQVGAASEEIRLVQEHLRRNSVAIRESRSKIEQKVGEAADQIEALVLKKGREMASKITQDADSQDLKDDARITAREIRDKSRKISQELERFILNETNHLEDELNDVANSDLAHNIRIRMEGKDPEVSVANFSKRQRSVPNSTGDVVKHIGSFLKTRSVANAGKSGLKAVSGSDTHKVIKNIGGWIGHKFKPWEAVKMADKVGKFGSFAAKWGGAISRLVLDLWDEHNANKQAEKMRKARASVRNQYRNMAEQMSESYDEVQKKVFGDLHDPALKSLRNDSDELMNLEEKKNDNTHQLKALRKEARRLSAELQA